jgi:hypothetical protein
MRSQDGAKWLNISTSQPFVVEGGLYALTWNASALTSVSITILSPDGSTQVAVMSPQSTTSGSQLVYLSPGAYTLTLSGATAFYGAISRVPIGD